MAVVDGLGIKSIVLEEIRCIDYLCWCPLSVIEPLPFLATYGFILVSSFNTCIFEGAMEVLFYPLAKL
jgi:hypothetical protein